jgi:hypothetical protein
LSRKPARTASRPCRQARSSAPIAARRFSYRIIEPPGRQERQE